MDVLGRDLVTSVAEVGGGKTREDGARRHTNALFLTVTLMHIGQVNTVHWGLPKFLYYTRSRNSMSDDEYVNEELLALLKQSLASGSSPSTPEKNVVLEDAEFIYDNSIDVAMDMVSTKAAAELIYGRMQEQGFSTQSWANHELHPKEKNAATVDFIFTMDLLNFSFWPDDPNGEAFTVHYREKSWTGYSSVLAVLWRALDEGSAATPKFQ